MPSFKPVNSPDEIKTKVGYSDAAKFDSKNKLITHKGHQYRIISKKERAFTSLERAGRVALGVLAVMGTLGFGLISKDFRKFVGKLFTKEQKTIRFAVPINTQELVKTLEGKDLKLDPELISQLRSDYMNLEDHIKIDGNIVVLDEPNYLENKTRDFKAPQTLDALIPNGLKLFFGEFYNERLSRTIALLFQQGITGELIDTAIKLKKNPHLGLKPIEGDTYPHFEFSNTNNEFTLSIKMDLALADFYTFPPKESGKNVTITYLINLSNKDAPIKVDFKD